MRRLGLRKAAIGLGLGRVDQVGKLDGVLDEEDRDVVADDVPVALFGIKLDGKAAHVARQVGRALVARHGREAHEGRGLFAGALEDIGRADLGQAVVKLEMAMCAVAARVDDPLGDALMIEMEDLLAHREIFQKGGTARSGAQRVLVVRDGDALGRRHLGDIAARLLVQLATIAADGLVVRIVH